MRISGGGAVWIGTAKREESPLRTESLRVIERVKKSPSFDMLSFLAAEDALPPATEYKPRDTVFRQGDPADGVFYVLRGRIRLSVVSEEGREGIIAMPGTGTFFGEGCLGGQSVRMASAVATLTSMVVRVDVETMMRLLREQPSLSQMFMTCILARNVEIESDLIDQLFNSGERRLARVLLLLANLSKESTVTAVIPKINHEILAARVGTSRSRISVFMNKFRKLGFIDYSGERGGEVKVHTSLMNALAVTGIVESGLPIYSSGHAGSVMIAAE